MNFNPIRRSPLKRKPRQAKQSAPWRRRKIRLDAKGMARLRSQAYARSQGQCECWMVKGRKRCGQRVNWSDGQLHHIVSRGRCGSDEIENVCFVHRHCHQEITGLPKFQWGWLEEIKTAG